ncbi:small GTP-binding protein [Histomonas meleagridis]|uniref:small GTP-binding protein n=1 Tax=Histomonas meleagridis TaxID=135588 RepID=UPI00355AB320|nr:small GTP-binding protein [Histomonas meleagridis]KAH0798634.1 small GTP-binding protein [Histomonas meleagridis]
MDLKIVLLGSAFVGKTSVANRYCNGQFQEETLSTIGAGFFTHSLKINNIEVTMMLWDTAGEERFRSVAPSLLRGANGLILVFDLTSKGSFEEIDIYMDMFLDVCKVDMKQNAPVLLLGNKADLPKVEISDDAIERWKSKNNVELYYPVSAKTGQNIEVAIEELVKQIIIPKNKPEEPPIQISLTVEDGNKKQCC